MLGVHMLLKALAVVSSLGFLAFAACGVAPEPTPSDGEVILPPEKTWEEAGLGEPGAAEMSNLAHAEEIERFFAERPMARTFGNASDNGGMSARADQYAVSGVLTPQRGTEPAPTAPPSSPPLLPVAPSPLLLAPGQPTPRALGPAKPAPGALGIARPAAGDPPTSHAMVCDDYGCSCVSR